MKPSDQNPQCFSFSWCMHINLIKKSYEPVHEISNNVVCATSKASDQPARMHTRSLMSLEYSMIGKLLTEHNLEFLGFKGGCRGSSESTLVKMSNCWKSHAAAHIMFSCTGQRN